MTEIAPELSFYKFYNSQSYMTLQILLTAPNNNFLFFLVFYI